MPVLNFKRIDLGWHFGTIEGYESKKSTTGNPMLVVEMSLDDGQFVDIWFVVQHWGAGVGDLRLDGLFAAIGESDIAGKLRRGQKVDYELDNLIGKQCDVFFNSQQQAMRFAPLHERTDSAPNGGR